MNMEVLYGIKADQFHLIKKVKTKLVQPTMSDGKKIAWQKTQKRLHDGCFRTIVPFCHILAMLLYCFEANLTHSWIKSIGNQSIDDNVATNSAKPEMLPKLVQQMALLKFSNKFDSPLEWSSAELVTKF